MVNYILLSSFASDNFINFPIILFLISFHLVPFSTHGSYFQVAIPVVPTIRVLVTFTKFEELQPLEDFSTPPSSPDKNYPSKKQPSSSWLQWMKGSSRQKRSKSSRPSNCVENIQDPFMIPPDYTWISPEAKKKKLQENKSKSKKRLEKTRRGPESVREER